MNFIRIVHQDSKGLVARISEILGLKNINIDKINAYSKKGFAVIQLYTPENDRALSVLNEAGYRAVPDENILVRIADRPGELARISRLLYDDDVDIRSITMMELGETENVVAIVTDKDGKAKIILKPFLIE